MPIAKDATAKVHAANVAAPKRMPERLLDVMLKQADEYREENRMNRGADKAMNFLNAMKKLYEVFQDDDVIMQIFAGIDRINPMSRYNTAIAFSQMVEGPGREVFDIERLTRVQIVLDKYYGSAASVIKDHMCSKLKTGDLEGLEFLCRTFGTREIIEIVGMFEAIENETIRQTGKSSMEGYFSANDIAYIASNTEDIGVAVEAAEFMSKNNDTFEKGYLRGKILETASWNLDAEGMRRVILFVKSLTEVEFNQFAAFFEWKNGRVAIAKFVNAGLDQLLKEDFSYFETIKLYLSTGMDIPAPTKETVRCYDYQKIIREHINGRYGIMLTNEQIGLFLRSGMHEEEESGVIDLIRLGIERDVKYYSLDVTGGIRPVDYAKTELEEHILAVLYGSRDKEKEKKAFEMLRNIVGESTINKARNDIRTKHREVLTVIGRILGNQAYLQDERIGRSLGALKSTGSEAVLDVLRAANYREIHLENANYLRAAQSKNPLDYDSEVQYACVYLPEPDKNGIYTYCSDERFVLVKYGIGDVTYGSAICYLEGKVLLVDSVEGNNAIKKSNVFEIIYNDLIERAIGLGAEKIVFGTYRNGNLAAQQFLRHVEEKGLPHEAMDLRLETEGYLEARDSDHVYALDLKTSARN